MLGRIFSRSRNILPNVYRRFSSQQTKSIRNWKALSVVSGSVILIGSCSIEKTSSKQNKKISSEQVNPWDIARKYKVHQFMYIGVRGGICFDIPKVSKDSDVTWDVVQANPDFPWSYYYLSQNHNITWEIVQANPDKPWNYSTLSANPNITWEIVQANPDKPWKLLDIICKP